MSINVGLLGLGNIGTGVAEYLRDRGNLLGLRLKAVAETDPAKRNNASLPNVALTDDSYGVIRDPDVPIIVELIGGEHPAYEYILEAINRGKAVVTANKFIIAKYGKQILDAARQRGVDVRFEASVGGGIPIIQAIREDLAANEIKSITGIVNGTTNYILTRMREGMEYADALRIAQQKGFAEKDPYLDVSGQDSKQKLAILASLAWNTWIDPESIPCEGITEITPKDIDFASEVGYAIKLLAVAKRHNNRAEVRVNPTLISLSHPLASVADEFNAIYLEGNLCGPQMYYGRGAGRSATTSAVVADIRHIARNIKMGVRDDLPSLDKRLSREEDTASGGYFRLDLKHIPGSLAKVADILARQGISVKDSVQRNKFRHEVNGETVIPDIITIEPINGSTIRKTLEELEQCDRVLGKPFYLRVEE